MKIVIVGPGAIGCLFAAHLARAKEEVWLLDRNKEKAAKISLGITVEDGSGSWRQMPKATSEPKEIGMAELLIVCVKSYQTKEAIERSRPLIGEGSAILTLQNGIGNIEIIQEAVGKERVIAGVTSQGATLIDTAHIRHAGKGETVIGRMDGGISAQMRSIREVFNSAGLKTRVCRDIKGLLWSKLVINVGINALTAATRLRNGRLIELEWTRRILKGAVQEAVQLARRKRIKLDFDDPLAKVEAVCEATSGNISSMLQDVLKKKRTEIDFINGVVVRQAEELGVAVPVNTLLWGLIKAIESSYAVMAELP